MSLENPVTCPGTQVSQEPGLPDTKLHIHPHIAHIGTDYFTYSVTTLFAASRFGSSDFVHNSLSSQRDANTRKEKMTVMRVCLVIGVWLCMNTCVSVVSCV